MAAPGGPGEVSDGGDGAGRTADMACFSLKALATFVSAGDDLIASSRRPVAP